MTIFQAAVGIGLLSDLLTPLGAQAFRCAGQGSQAAGLLPAGAVARPAQVSTTGTRQALVLFARFAGDSQTPGPEWAAFSSSQPRRSASTKPD